MCGGNVVDSGSMTKTFVNDAVTTTTTTSTTTTTITPKSSDGNSTTISPIPFEGMRSFLSGKSALIYDIRLNLA